MSCVFYGKSGVANFMLVETHGNQCALVVTSHHPCAMEMEGVAPDDKQCPLIEIMRDHPGDFPYQQVLIEEFLDKRKRSYEN
jgi:hypothetical protein